MSTYNLVNVQDSWEFKFYTTVNGKGIICIRVFYLTEDKILESKSFIARSSPYYADRVEYYADCVECSSEELDRLLLTVE